MSTKWTLVKTVLGIVVLIFLVSFSAKRHGCKPVTDVKIKVDHESGKFFVNDSLVRKVLEGKQFKVSEVALGNMEVDQVESLLDRNSFIKKSEVFQDVNGELNVKIYQETPIARINTGVDEFYLSEDLNKMPLSTLHSAEVLIVGGRIEEEDFEGLKDLTEYISADKLLKKHIIAVKKEKPNSFILLVNKGDYIIEFGELKNFDSKFEKLKLFYDQFLGKVGLNYYERINLRYNNQIVATKRINDDKQ
ncbi:cell division protein FtsQ/DivIB [Moheibacter lacus]|uniref:Cell division protein FtsQ n=1 Tax=Moheibacter lacus TaxID=2745851 RepID=A0A838ZM01_9FLAO|nr:cell division protein FtsQ [Moheibacter lacus]MBA5629534.1 cell division protein FtsQ [Moheibacter lacus]